MRSVLPRLDHALVRSGALAGRAGLIAPDVDLLDLPERAVQFGTGAFLRGFVDCLIDDANRRGAFRGRVVAVSSTGSGRDAQLNLQNGLFTLVVQGMSAGAPVRDTRVVASVSRALSATDEWDAVLACARNPDLALVISNTTEVGITLDAEDRADAAPPRSFPGKLARFLFERARAFGFARERGVVVLPCELIEKNGDRLRDIVLALAARWELPGAFARWIEQAVPFCNTLVDRIVPGAPDAAEGSRLRSALGYDDAMLTTCEVYRLLAIEGDAAVRERLGFAAPDDGVIVARDISPYRERKVRLLNGAHTILAPLALLCGCQTVGEAMQDPLVGAFVRRALFDEMVPGVHAPGAEEFARHVLDRFANPFLRHALRDITLQQTMKLRVRVVPSIIECAARTGEVPAALAFGFAAYLLFMGGAHDEQHDGAARSRPADDRGGPVRTLWASVHGDGVAALRALAHRVCGDDTLWGADLTCIVGFSDAVADALTRMHRGGARAALAAFLALAPAPHA